MSGLVAFITARLDKDEAMAKTAAGVAGPDWAWKTEVTISDEVTDYLTNAAGTLLADTMGGSDGDIAEHIARHDPARVFRDVAAGRAILAEHRQWVFGGMTGCSVCHAGHEIGDLPPGLCPTLRALASAWSDHPDYAAAVAG